MQQSGCGNGVTRSRLLVMNETAANACLNYGGAASFQSGSTTMCAAGSIPLPANGGGLDDNSGFVSNEQVSAVCATSACSLTVKSY